MYYLPLNGVPSIPRSLTGLPKATTQQWFPVYKWYWRGLILRTTRCNSWNTAHLHWQDEILTESDLDLSSIWSCETRVAGSLSTHISRLLCSWLMFPTKAFSRAGDISSDICCTLDALVMKESRRLWCCKCCRLKRLRLASDSSTVKEKPHPGKWDYAGHYRPFVSAKTDTHQIRQRHT